MPGSFTFSPIEANLTRDVEFIGKMSPYCSFQIGEKKVTGEVCKKGGKHPQWKDVLTVPAPITLLKDSVAVVQVMDKDKFMSDDLIGTMKIDLNEIQSSGHLSKWYPIYYNDKPAGEILLDSNFKGTDDTLFESTDYRGEKTETEFDFKSETTEKKFYQEQRQVVEPHTFTKEVDAVEINSVKQTIEVMEPVKVTKDVEYTDMVPVTKTIETTEPQVVKKQVEVIEPRLVTKTIQVVENVPVMKEVEVIENKSVTKEVETFEPQTFTKQVEITEYVPVTKEVEVTEPVHVKKDIEYVESIITTKTITKEIPQTVIVDEKITTEVGPSTLLHTDILSRDLLKKEVLDKDILSKDFSGKTSEKKEFVETEIFEEKRL